MNYDQINPEMDIMKTAISKQEKLIKHLEAQKAMYEFRLSDEPKYIEVYVGGTTFSVLVSNNKTGIDAEIINLLDQKISHETELYRKDLEEAKRILLGVMMSSTLTDDGK